MKMTKIAYVFPGQGAQFSGMGKDLYKSNVLAKELFDRANDILGFYITDIMFDGTDEDLKQTKVTQPAVFLHSVIRYLCLDVDDRPDMVAGHSLGEFSALVAAGVLSFEDALSLVSKRAIAMQKACELRPSTMAAVLGIEDSVVAEILFGIKDTIVVPANYNCPGQIVISGTIEGVEKAGLLLKEAGAKRVLPLKVSGAFHSPIMQPAGEELSEAISSVDFKDSKCPVYQNFVAKAVSEAKEIRENLKEQLVNPVRWTESVRAMVADGAVKFVEVGPGSVLQGLVKKIDASVDVMGYQ